MGKVGCRDELMNLCLVPSFTQKIDFITLGPRLYSETFPKPLGEGKNSSPCCSDTFLKNSTFHAV